MNGCPPPPRFLPQSHVRSTISRYKLAAERGADPDYLREVQAYVQVRAGSGGWRVAGALRGCV